VNGALRVLTDVGVGKHVEDWLRTAGYDVQAVRDVDPRMSDDDILAWAVREARLVMTMDKDFGEMVYRSGQAHAGVLLLRLDDATGEEKTRVVRQIFTRHGHQLADHFSVYQNGRLRIR
jgi:predicted nuclease of predicted toxin-antitoxin system